MTQYDMKYFKSLTPGQISRSCILVSWWSITAEYYNVSYRNKSGDAAFNRYSSVSRYPPKELYGDYVEITEQEAMLLDPSLFKITFKNYDEYKRALETMKPKIGLQNT